jgi:OmcA/MtrC family decaheme c-type cytochrome
MRTQRWWVALGAVVATLVISTASCGDDDDDDDGGTGNGGGQVDPDPLNLEIQSVTIPSGASPRPVIRFRVTDQAGAAVDLVAEIANWNLGVPTTANRVTPNSNPRFTLAQLEDDGDYLSLYSATVAPQSYTPQPGTVPPTGSAEQATSQPPSRVAGAVVTFPASDLVAVGNGVYDFTMPAITAASVDGTKTHTAAGWIVRSTVPGDQDVAYDSYNFLPAGGTAQLDQVVTDDACNRCHGVLQAHGTRRGTQLCITCHSPQTVDPETSRTVDFKVMVHKIHMGAGLPSVQQDPATNYFIVGNSQNVHDYSEVAFPWHDGVQHCTVCHVGGEDSDNWKNRPSAAACTSCHDNVKFDGTGTGACNATPSTYPADCNHSGGLFTVTNPSESTSCAACHRTGGVAPVENFHHGD